MTIVVVYDHVWLVLPLTYLLKKLFNIDRVSYLKTILLWSRQPLHTQDTLFWFRLAVLDLYNLFLIAHLTESKLHFLQIKFRIANYKRWCRFQSNMFLTAICQTTSPISSVVPFSKTCASPIHTKRKQTLFYSTIKYGCLIHTHTNSYLYFILRYNTSK